ncbi:hypothetical protein OBBRIDRAFT_795102 [Obba rivulosa]|uniref:Uncharacterized protein n=1 Tax=Obba rivulosa TaxID=1052685 RepID=A0A8E2APL6_9APHY|nr:hypothetical protein OBBRIDRAFT_795102 [Obba rivulosa]
MWTEGDCTRAAGPSHSRSPQHPRTHTSRCAALRRRAANDDGAVQRRTEHDTHRLATDSRACT